MAELDPLDGTADEEVNADDFDVQDESADEGEGVDEADEAPVVRRLRQYIGRCLVPYGYEVWRDGVYRRAKGKQDESGNVGKRRERREEPVEDPSIDAIPSPERRRGLSRICAQPLWISRVGRTFTGREEEGEDLVELVTADAFLGGYKRQWVSKGQITHRGSLIQLGAVGYPVRTENAPKVEDYLDALLAENRISISNSPGLPFVRLGARSGAYEIMTETGKQWGWLLGDRWVGSESVESDDRCRSVYNEGFVTAGAFDEWKVKYREVTERSLLARWIVNSAFAAPLLRFAAVRTFIIHQWGDTGRGKCLTGETLVSTKSGIRRIKDLDSEKYVDGFNAIQNGRRPSFWNGESFQEATHFFRQKHQPIVKIASRRGYEIRGTLEHPLMTDRGWVKLADITTSDKIKVVPPMFAPIKSIVGVTNTGKITTHGDREPAERRLTPDVGRLLGYLIADGSCNEEHRLQLTSDPEVLDDACRIVKKQWNADGSRYAENNHYWGGAAFRGAIAAFDLPYEKAAGKRVPASVLLAPKVVVREFIRGYMECEGSFGNRAIEVTSASEQLAREVQVLLLGFGVEARRHVKMVVPPGHDEARPYWRLTIQDAPNMRRYMEEFGPITSDRRRQMTALLAEITLGAGPIEAPVVGEFDEIVSISNDGFEDVYDVTIPEGHAFTANGVLSHNSAISAFAMCVYGKPYVMMANFNATTTSMTETFRYVDDLPQFWDELQSASDQSFSEVIYAITNQKGRRRAKQYGGLADEIKSWRSVVYFTGEEPILGRGRIDLGGQAHRVIEINTAKLNIQAGMDSSQAHALHTWMERTPSCGWAGAEFLRCLGGVVNDPSGIARLQENVNVLTDRIREYTGVAPQRASQLAVVAVGQMLAERWLFGTEPNEAAIRAFEDAVSFGRVLAEADDSQPIAFRALQALRDHRDALRECWLDTRNPAQRVQLEQGSFRKLFGIINEGEVWLIQSEVNKHLKLNGYAHGRVWADLKSMGKLELAVRTRGMWRNTVYIIPLEMFEL